MNYSMGLFVVEVSLIGVLEHVIIQRVTVRSTGALKMQDKVKDFVRNATASGDQIGRRNCTLIWYFFLPRTLGVHMFILRSKYFLPLSCSQHHVIGSDSLLEGMNHTHTWFCLLYTSDAADE